MIAFTRDQLRSFAPVAKAEIISAFVDGIDEINEAGINTPLRLQHFLAQVAVETGGLRLLEENLSYSAERLVQVWPKRFPNKAAAAPYARNPEKLANKVYGGRLGNVKAGDGFAYRGSGALQTTGRFNFKAAGYEENPEALRQPATAITAALKFWVQNGCNAFADRDDLTGLRKRINGGSHGLAEAKNYLAKAKKVFIGTPAIALTADVSKGQIKALQEQLISLGYVSAGKPDGVIGAMTIGAISAFQAENGLEVNGRFDEATKAQLYEATPRVVVRSTEAPEGSRILSGAGVIKKGAVGLLGAIGVDTFDDPIATLVGLKGKLDQVKAILAPYEGLTLWLSQHWVVPAALVLAAGWYYAHKIEKARIEDHASGVTA
jgi:putative chitinase